MVSLWSRGDVRSIRPISDGRGLHNTFLFICLDQTFLLLSLQQRFRNHPPPSILDHRFPEHLHASIRGPSEALPSDVAKPGVPHHRHLIGCGVSAGLWSCSAHPLLQRRCRPVNGEPPGWPGLLAIDSAAAETRPGDAGLLTALYAHSLPAALSVGIRELRRVMHAYPTSLPTVSRSRLRPFRVFSPLFAFAFRYTPLLIKVFV